MNNNQDPDPDRDLILTDKDRHDRDLLRRLDAFLDPIPGILGIADNQGLNDHPDRAALAIILAGDQATAICNGKSLTLAAALTGILGEIPGIIEPLLIALSRVRPGIIESYIADRLAEADRAEADPADLPS